MRTALAILVPFVALSLAGCSDRLNPGTEMMLTREGATMLHVQNMEKGHRPDQVSEGTKVRVAKQGIHVPTTDRAVRIHEMRDRVRDVQARICAS